MTMEPRRSVVICVILLFSIGSGTSINGGTGNWGQTIICPNADVCLTEAQQELLYPVHNRPCCTDCNCNGDCSCCSDKTSDSGSPSKRVCKSTMVKKRGSNKDKYFYDGFIDGINSYFITDRCPTDEQNIDVREKCLSIDKTTLDDYIWVSDTTTGKIFQNHHCAKCHGTKDWKSWNIRTQCSPLSDASFVNITATLYSENCNIINEAPEELAAKIANDRCFNPTISFCNQTGYWNIYHDFVYTGCNFNTAPHLPNEEMAVDVFENMFCYICNTDDVSSTEMVCLAALFNSSDMTSNPYIQRSKSITFSALIDYRGGSEDEKGSSECAFEQIYDKYMVS